MGNSIIKGGISHRYNTHIVYPNGKFGKKIWHMGEYPFHVPHQTNLDMLFTYWNIPKIQNSNFPTYNNRRDVRQMIERPEKIIPITKIIWNAC